MAAFCYVVRKINGWTTDRAQDIADAARLASRAAELGKDDAVALAFGGLALGYVVGDLEGAVALIDRALALNPNLATAWYASGTVRAFRGGEPDRRDRAPVSAPCGSARTILSCLRCRA